MKKVLIAILGLLTLATASSFATQTRTLVMGENDMIMVDDYNMFRFPGRVNNYPNLAMGEFCEDEDDLYSFGITWQFDEENPWVLGTFASYEPQFGPYSFWGDNLAEFPYYYYYPSMAMAPGSEEQLSDSYSRRMQIIYGRKLGGNNFGFSAEVVRASWEAKEDSGDVIDFNFNPKQSFHQYTFGLGLTEGTSGKWDVGLSFMTGGWTDEDPDGHEISKPKGFMDLSLEGRYFWVRNPKITMVPHASFAIGKRGAEWLNDPDANDDNETEEYSLTAFDLGCGMNYTPAPNILAVVDFGFAYETIKAVYDGGTAISDASKGEEKETFVVFPYMKLGFEGEVFNWMDIRAGGYTTLWSSSDKWESDFDVDETWNTPHTNTYFGFGFNWGKLYLDTYTDPEIILDGFNFISGSTDVEDLNWQVSMVYEMF